MATTPVPIPVVGTPPDYPVRAGTTDKAAFLAQVATADARFPIYNNELNAATDAINAAADATYINTLASASNAVAADTSASAAAEYAQAAAATANFVGDWSSLSGSASFPLTAYYNGQFWALLQDVSNISAYIPSDTSPVWARVQAVDIIRTPVLIAPLTGATGVSPAPQLEAGGYANIYGFARDYREFQVDLSAGDFSVPVWSTQIDADTTAVGETLAFNAGYKWRCRDVAVDGTVGRWSSVAVFSTGAVSIAQPTLTVEGAPDDVPETPTLTSSAFTVIGGTDEHLNTDWQVFDDQLAVIWESPADAANKLEIDVPAGILQELNTYTFRVRHRGVVYGVSPWRTVVATTKEKFGSDVGEAGTQGFGVGVYPNEADLVSLGLTGMTGYTDPASPNYGNYIHNNSSVMVFVPKFYYRIGNESSPRFASYGLNAIDISGADEAGYVLHRAFIDGGSEKHGFFIDKYLISKNAGGTAAVSVKNGVPIGLTTSSTYTNSNGFLGGTGILADAVLLCRSRGTNYNQTSAFMYSALALLATAHAQAATSTTFCAWYDPTGTTNFVKGCNNNALSDANDTSITFTTAGDSGASAKPLTGSAVPFAKTTHNGQECGIADLNGTMFEPALGVTSPGTSATSTTKITSTTFYILKESVALKDLTHGWNTGTDAWGNTAHIESLYDSYTAPTAINGSTVVYWGNGNNQVFSGASTGVNYQVEGFMPLNNTSMSASGTNQFGNDYYYNYNRHNMFPLVGGRWGSSAAAGLFYRTFLDGRSTGHYAGCRGSAYAG